MVPQQRGLSGAFCGDVAHMRARALGAFLRFRVAFILTEAIGSLRQWGPQSFEVFGILSAGPIVFGSDQN